MAADRHHLDPTLDPAVDVAAYERDGVVCVRGAVPDEWVERMRTAVNRIMREPGPYSKREVAPDGTGRFHNDMFMWTRDDDFRAYVFDSPAADLARTVMRATRVTFFYDHLLVKQPQSAEPTPWHHDLPYWPIAGDQICSVWLALDAATLENGAVEYVAGSHRWDRRFEPETFIPGRPLDRQGLEQVPDIDAHRDEYRILSWDVEPGDCLVHHALTVHGAPGNSATDRARRGLSTRFTGDDARYAPHVGTFRLLRDPGLAPGDPMDCDLFPSVRPRAATAPS